MISYGIDIGTTTLRACAVDVTVSALGLRSYEPVGDSLCDFTPFIDSTAIDAGRVLELLNAWQAKERVPGPEIGTVLFTGEAQRARNCESISKAILDAFPSLLSAQLDPHWESVVATHGAGAIDLSRRHPGTPVVHLDIGGGTSNYAWLENGEIIDTACLDLGCRKWVLDPKSGQVLRTTPAGIELERELGRRLHPDLAVPAMSLVSEKLLGFARRVATASYVVDPWRKTISASAKPIVSFSGGIVECWDWPIPDFSFGDLGPFLAAELKKRLAAEGWSFHLSSYQGRATSLGVSAFGFQVSGNSLHGDGFRPLKNVPLFFEADFLAEESVPRTFAVLSSVESSSVDGLSRLAKEWLAVFDSKRLSAAHHAILILESNLAKSLGHFYEKAATPRAPRLWVLDGIKGANVSGSSLKTLDIAHPTATGNIPVVLKALRLF